MDDIINSVGRDTPSGKVTMMDLWQQSIDRNRAANSTAVTEKPAEKTKAEIADKLKEDIRAGRVECPTCAARRYVDQSDDSSVSFQTPQKISPAQSKSAVVSHEREHVVNEDAKARAENKEVISSSVTLQYSKCPDCGASYVAGGLTSTTTRTKPEESHNANADNINMNSIDMRI